MAPNHGDQEVELSQTLYTNSHAQFDKSSTGSVPAMPSLKFEGSICSYKLYRFDLGLLA